MAIDFKGISGFTKKKYLDPDSQFFNLPYIHPMAGGEDEVQGEAEGKVINKLYKFMRQR